VVGEDIEARADILISEILSSDLLAEDVLSTFEDAHAGALREERRSFRVRRPRWDAWWKATFFPNTPSSRRVGIDISPLARWRRNACRYWDHDIVAQASEDIDLLRIDLSAREI